MQLEFVGDLSIQDARCLAKLAAHSTHILEFGVGGSTQIFAQCRPDELVCVDTDQGWIGRTSKNLGLIKSPITNVQFALYHHFQFQGLYNLIFVDGAPEKRLDFAMRAWPILDTGGCMVFHDTRRFEYFREAAWVMQSFFGEVAHVSVNANDSNLTIIEKGSARVYENWNLTEGKPAWAYGNGDIPEGEGLWKMEK